MNRGTLSLLCIFAGIFLLADKTNAQSFQWGKRAGSAQSVSESNWEHVNSMAVDVHGNVYALGHVAQDGINVDGDVKTGNGDWDVVLASFTCSGSLRWWKVIGGPSRDFSYTLCTDKLDGVYLSCYLDRSQSGNTIHIDSDTTFSGNSLRAVSLIKYDTGGHYKWFRAPQADTIGSNSYGSSYELGMTVDSAGTVYWMWQMGPSVYFNGTFTVPVTNDYIIKYDRYGGLVGTIDLKSLVHDGHLILNKANGQFYYAGVGTSSMLVNGTTLTSSKFIAAFDKNGNLKWLKQGEARFNTDGFDGNIGLDQDGNIYLASNLEVGEKFMGYAPTLTHSAPMITKLDINGNFKWAATGIVNAATFTNGGVAVRNSGEVILHGKFPGLLKWPGDSTVYNLPLNTGYRPFIARFNTQTGRVLGLDQLPASGCDQFATVSDGRDNVYLGGDFSTTITIAGNTLSKIGGETDWYFAKYGQANCNCTNVPEPLFSMTATGKNANFNYAGSTGITTYRWDFGDGDTAITANPAHSFKDSGSYIVCLKVTNSCGDNTYCSQVYIYPTDVANIIKVGDVRIYPNPVNDILTLDQLQAGMSIIVSDLYGRIIIKHVVTNKQEQFNTADWSPGTYFVQITDEKGDRYNQKVVKE
ncbi:PKD domain-containing protein [uncultured Dysgonomonas sp.]|uniref:PKD domain-containing protein n=1 Tax=uncultured Dysgonomonas sp. TaxID=206096 RepID=UPI002625A232|nr:PKD domain-containing protein [uncultured Dysgonomonas sp.]